MNYLVTQPAAGETELRIEGLEVYDKDDGDEGSTQPFALLLPGLQSALLTQADWWSAILCELYDTLQSNDKLEDGDTFEVSPFQHNDIAIEAWRFSCVGFAVVPVWASVSEELRRTLRAEGQQCNG